MNITEDYVSNEVYKLLKEKGFDGEIHTTFDEEGYTRPSITHQMAMKWLREVYNIDIEVHADVGMLGVKVYTPFISRYKSSTEYPSKLRQYKNGLYFEDDRGVIPGIRHFETYEEAVEAALKYCLENLI